MFLNLVLSWSCKTLIRRKSMLPRERSLWMPMNSINAKIWLFRSALICIRFRIWVENLIRTENKMLRKSLQHFSNAFRSFCFSAIISFTHVMRLFWIKYANYCLILKIPLTCQGLGYYFSETFPLAFLSFCPQYLEYCWTDRTKILLPFLLPALNDLVNYCS